MTGLLLIADWKGDNYNLILVIVNQFSKMMYYKSVKITINVLGLAKVIIDVVVRHYGLLVSIISDWGAIFTSKFWSLLCYFFDIKQQLFNAFYPQTNG